MFDVVIVPDFSGKGARAYEARTLLFLASWIENAGRAREFPLHIACVGEPPASVRWLADRCGAFVSVHAPVGDGLRGSANKLRGLEVDGRTDRFFLLDVDTVILSDPSELSEFGRCIAAAPANVPRVPEAYWRRIYPKLGLELPSERISCVAAEMSCQPRLGIIYPEQVGEMTSMLPYFNGGVVFAPWDCGFRELWESHMRTILTLFTERDAVWKHISASDMTGLATTIQSLRVRGIPFERLPASYNTIWWHYYRGVLSVEETKVFHAMFIFGKTTAATYSLAMQLYRFRLHVMHRLVNDWRREERGRLTAARRFLLPSLVEANRLGDRLQQLFRKHALPALERA
jgi:hypothetical protein